ncbi:MAG: M6 family metalloprotease domain-containing protein [Muribaculaceae bacterium]|nr:M6 family metalloprotease domain-containing protein [Muribaculaceae bacterium]
MRKLLAIILTLTLCCGAVYAVPAKHLVKTVKQPDGKSLTLKLVGDEWSHGYVTTDELAIAQGEDGAYYYRTTGGLTTVVAHDKVHRSAEEQRYVTTNAESLRFDNIAAQVKQHTSKAPMRVSTPQVPNNGAPKIPVLMINFKDVQFKDENPQDSIMRMFMGADSSAYRYFVDQSGGKFTPQFDIYGPVTLNYNRAIFGANNASGRDRGVGTMAAAACMTLNSSVNFKKYDNDGDGECDVVIVLYAGVGEASSYVEDAVWPCQWSLSASDYGKSLFYDNVTINKFAVFNELNGVDTTRIDGIGTLCPEFSHCLGLPDFYETYNSHGYYGMGNWSLMDHGCYNGDGYIPIGYSAYEKNFMGWMELEDATPNTYYNLPVLNDGDDKAIKIINENDSDEYYILENRQQQGWDRYIASNGMLVTHVTYKESVWNANTVNNTATQRMTIIPADNVLTRDSEEADLYPYNGNDSITDTSVPAAKVYKGGFMHKPITKIKLRDDNNVTLWYMMEPFDHNAPQLNEARKITSTSFTTSWSEEPNAEYYTLEVVKKAAEGDSVACDSVCRVIPEITSTSVVVDSLEAYCNYEFRVKALYNDDVESAFSEAREVTLDDIYLYGDVNGDKIVNITDINVLLMRIMGNNAVMIIQDNADLDEDGVFTVADVIRLVSIIMENNQHN